MNKEPLNKEFAVCMQSERDISAGLHINYLKCTALHCFALHQTDLFTCKIVKWVEIYLRDC